MNHPQKTVRVQYYALLREQRGCNNEEVTTSAQTAGKLYDELQKRHGFSLPPDSLRVAINDAFEGWDTEIKPNDVVAFIPPVAGG